MRDIDVKSVNSIRVLAAEAIEKAKSGHPGLPLGSAPMAYELWSKHMKINPANPNWADRDRFILSGGHGSALLYSLLYMFGYGLTMDDMKTARLTYTGTSGVWPHCRCGGYHRPAWRRYSNGCRYGYGREAPCGSIQQGRI